ncbi:MAG: hypothetical protein DRP30_03420 [Thermotoga sp.]|nr:MAG: hypothetical protein DRP30_03420 [Thermotoga sp.]
MMRSSITLLFFILAVSLLFSTVNSIIIGNSNYEYSQDLFLNYPSENIDFFKEIVSKYMGIGDEEINIMVGENADKDEILGFFESIFQREGRGNDGDLLLFYYAGYGFSYGDEGFISPFDYDPTNPIESSISFTEIAELLSEFRMRKIVILEIWDQKAPDFGTIVDLSNLGELEKVVDSMIVVDYHSRKIVWNFPKMSVGMQVIYDGFTKGVTDGNLDNVITDTEWFEFMDRKIKEISSDFNLRLDVKIFKRSGVIVTSSLGVSRKNHSPTKPKLIYPPQGEKIKGDELTFMWESSDPDNDRLFYDLYVGTAPDNLELVAREIPSPYFHRKFTESGVYYWKVIAKDSRGGISESELNSFEISIPVKEEKVSPVPQAPRTMRSGWLYITSIPSGADVFINGVYKGKTPLRLALSEGVYNVKVRLDNHNSKEINIDVVANVEKRITFKFKMKTKESGIPMLNGKTMLNENFDGYVLGEIKSSARFGRLKLEKKLGDAEMVEEWSRGFLRLSKSSRKGYVELYGLFNNVVKGRFTFDFRVGNSCYFGFSIDSSLRKRDKNERRSKMDGYFIVKSKNAGKCSLSFVNGTKRIKISDLSTNVWHNFTMDFDLEEKRALVYLDGKKVARIILSVPHKYYDFLNLVLFTGKTCDCVDIDNLAVYKMQ